jgi:hypothetical protein
VEESPTEVMLPGSRKTPGNDGTETSRQRYPDDSDDQTDERMTTSRIVA